MLKRIISVTLIMCMVFSTGCSFNSEERAKEKAISSFIEAGSYRQEITSTGTLRLDIDGDGEDVKFNNKTTQELIKDPIKTEIISNLEMAGDKIENHLYIINEDEKYNIYRKQSDASEWTKLELYTRNDALVAIDAAGGWDMELSDNYDSYQKLADESITDSTQKKVDCFVYSFKVSAEGFSSQIKACAMAAGNSLGVYKYGNDIVNKALESVSGSLGDVTVKVYIDKENKCICMISCDMREIMDKFMANLLPKLSSAVKEEEEKADKKDEDYGGVSFGEALEKVKISAKEMNIIVNYSKIDSVKDIVIPDEVKAADLAKTGEEK